MRFWFCGRWSRVSLGARGIGERRVAAIGAARGMTVAPALACFALSSVAWSDSLLTISDKGLPAGQIRWSVRVNRRERVDRQTITPPGNGPKKEMTWRWNSKGEPTRIEMSMATTSIVNGHISRGKTVIVTEFPTNKLPKTTIRIPGKTLHPNTPPPVEPMTDPSAFWFVRDHPKPGDTVEFCAFDILNLHWQHVERIFVGRQTISGFVGELNVVKENRDMVESTMYLDDHAEPVLIVSGDTKMVRK